MSKLFRCLQFYGFVFIGNGNSRGSFAIIYQITMMTTR